MKTKLLLYLIIFSGILISSCQPRNKDARVLLVTGGHSFDTTEFFSFFYSLENIDLDTISQPRANEFLLTDEGNNYDVYVFYDMWKEITDEQKSAYMKLTELGKALLFMHHSLASYQKWDEFKKIVGGKYHESRSQPDSSLHSDYAHDLDLFVHVLDPGHPVTRNMADFSIHDEGYSNLELIDGITPLLTTSHPECNEVIGWTNSYRNSVILYLIFGHDKKAYEDEDFRRLISNALEWLRESNTSKVLRPSRY